MSLQKEAEELRKNAKSKLLTTLGLPLAEERYKQIERIIYDRIASGNYKTLET